MGALSLKPVVGLVGTCGNSKWREDVAIPLLVAAGVEYFNPVVADWNDQAMEREADHGKTDKVILMVITGETTAFASLAESGWLALRALQSGQKVVIVLQDMAEGDEPKKDEKGGSFTPNKTRKVLRKHIAALPAEVQQCVCLCDDVSLAAQKAIELLKA